MERGMLWSLCTLETLQRVDLQGKDCQASLAMTNREGVFAVAILPRNTQGRNRMGARRALAL